MDSHSGSAAAASRAPDPKLLGTTRTGISLDGIRATISQRSRPSAVEMANRDLYATLQLLANRIQYLTRASAATIALREGAELLCEASAGPMATELGASIRTDPSLINQSIIAEQIFCCNNTRDAVSGEGKRYRDLGIKSIMVMPLFRASKVLGVLELLADGTNAFNDSHGDLLEHFAELVLTALAQAEAAKRVAIGNSSEEKFEIPALAPEPEKPTPISSAAPLFPAAASTVIGPASEKLIESPPESISRQEEAPAASVEPSIPITSAEAPSAPTSAVLALAPEAKVESLTESISSQKQNPVTSQECPEPASAAASVKVQFCEVCGFPVSEGRKLCLDCEEGRTGADAGAAPGFLSQLEREGKQGWLEDHFYTIGTVLMAALTVLALVLKFR
ncbi:MAG: GAF domain-containing protein [Acidobacteriaceae bacterium]|nr:GAF domain-containing protein [Acidobacteriaceae bacterium]